MRLERSDTILFDELLSHCYHRTNKNVMAPLSLYHCRAHLILVRGYYILWAFICIFGQWTPLSTIHDKVIKWNNFPHYWPFDVFFGLLLNKRLSTESGRRWFHTTSCLSWRHCNEWASQMAGGKFGKLGNIVVEVKGNSPFLLITERRMNFYLK